jgi:transcriptional regulator with XRE-family HTH domain
MAKAPNITDQHVGARVRMRRLQLGMSQTVLADALELTFQQVQKYEKGVNRMGASRLQQAGDILGVAVPFFFEGAAGGYQGNANALLPTYIDDFVASEDGLRLAKAFMRVRPAVRRCIVDLVNEIAGEDGN